MAAVGCRRRRWLPRVRSLCLSICNREFDLQPRDCNRGGHRCDRRCSSRYHPSEETLDALGPGGRRRLGTWRHHGDDAPLRCADLFWLPQRFVRRRLANWRVSSLSLYRFSGHVTILQSAAATRIVRGSDNRAPSGAVNDCTRWRCNRKSSRVRFRAFPISGHQVRF